MSNSSTAVDQESKALKPIYEALDQHQYSKAYKFSYAKACCGLPLAKALRAHALERNKRTLEALLVIRSLLNSLSWSIYNKKDGLNHKYLYWLELEELIWSLRVSGVEIIDEDLFKNNGIDTAIVSGMTRESDSRSCIKHNSSTKVTITSSGKGKKKKGGKKPSTSASSAISNVSSMQISDKKMLPLELIDVLDTPKWERKQIIFNFIKTSGYIPEQKIDSDVSELILDEVSFYILY